MGQCAQRSGFPQEDFGGLWFHSAGRALWVNLKASYPSDFPDCARPATNGATPLAAAPSARLSTPLGTASRLPGSSDRSNDRP